MDVDDAAGESFEKLAADVSDSPSRSNAGLIGPIGVKDLCFTADAPTEGGSAVLAGFRPTEDAEVVRRLRDAGAIVVGKTMTHEFAWTHHLIPTRNAWDTRCFPGGSSAGSAVAVAARSAFGAIGSDTGGSIRIPAALNGIVGLKPTFGRVSRRGVLEMSPSFDHVGPMTRTVEDAALVLQAIAGRDPGDPTSLDVPVPDYSSNLDRGVRGLRLGIERDYFFYDKVTPEVRELVEQALAELEELGAELVEVEIPELALSAAVSLPIILADTSANHRRLLRERGERYRPGIRFMLELGELVLAVHYLTAQRARRFVKDAVARAFALERLDALAVPTLPSTTFQDDEDTFGTVTESEDHPFGTYVRHSFPGNLTGQPALTVPCGFSPGGLPAGLQVIGRPFEEATVLRIGRAYETATGWFRRRPAAAGTIAAGETSTLALGARFTMKP